MFPNVIHYSLNLLYHFNTSNQEEAVSQYDEGGGFILIALVIWLVSLFISRRFMLKHVLKQMNKSSELAKITEPEILKESEVKALNTPTFVELNVDTERDSAIVLRESYVRRAYILFRKKYLYGILACVIYIGIPVLFSKFGGEGSEEIINDQLTMIIGLSVFYFVYITLVFLFYRRQYRPENTKFGLRWEHPAFSILRKIVNPAFQSYITIGIIFLMASFGFLSIQIEAESELAPGTTFIWTTIGYLLAAAFHFYLIMRIRNENKNVKNLSLLILRVFGNKRQTILTFGKLTEFWKHIGTWFTVVDPSFVASRYKIFSLKTFLTMFAIFVFAFFIGIKLTPFIAPLIEAILPTGFASQSEIEEFTVIPGMLIAWFLYFKYWKFMVSRSYAKDKNDIERKISKMISRPRNTDMTFKNLPMYCYDNTWKIAVSEFINNSQGILMDLRGFSAERKGCEYEIDFLLDKMSINKVLFLVDVKSDIEFVKETVKERFELLRTSSPNHKNENPTAKIFVSDDQKESEVQAIIDHLIETVHI